MGYTVFMNKRLTKKNHGFIRDAKKVLDIEAKSLIKLSDGLGESFVDACEAILACEGRVVVTGMGKSGHIGRKISATLSSTGTPSFFVHPGEASHGDLGMITKDDLVIVISYSGESQELNLIVPFLKREGIKLIAITSNQNSTLASVSNVVVLCQITEEACPLGLAPTSSTTTTLALGDALAVALLRTKGFTEADFARSHPGGALGRKLLTRISEISHSGDELPTVSSTGTLNDAIIEMTSKKLGVTCVIETEELVGIITDGDLRRVLQTEKDLSTLKTKDIMSVKPKSISEDALLAEAVKIMEQYQVNHLATIDKNKKLSGIIGMHDLLKARVL